jgi:hypothetical protein
MTISPVRQREHIPWMIRVIQIHLIWFGTLQECDAYYCPMSLLPAQYHLFRSDGQRAGVSIGRECEESNVV